MVKNNDEMEKSTHKRLHESPLVGKHSSKDIATNGFIESRRLAAIIAFG